MTKQVSFLFFLLVLASCSSDDPSVDCTSSTLSLSVQNTTDDLCDLGNGSLSVSASGGSGNYSYRLDNNMISSTGEFTGLSAGTYVVIVSDGDCAVETQVSIGSEQGVIISEVDLADAGCGTSAGSISVNAAEGTAPYKYSLDEGDFQTDNRFQDLEAGEYLIRVEDDQGCITIQEVQVLSGISWSQEVSEIISTNCALPDCHGGNQSPDFREFQNVVDNADRIKTRTSNGSMPPVTMLASEDVQSIACWVDDGAPDN